MVLYRRIWFWNRQIISICGVSPHAGISKIMRFAIEAVLAFAMVVSGGVMTMAQPRNTPAVSGSLISVAALKKLKRRYTLLAH